jgi:hypothetical protein
MLRYVDDFLFLPFDTFFVLRQAQDERKNSSYFAPTTLKLRRAQQGFVRHAGRAEERNMIGPSTFFELLRTVFAFLLSSFFIWVVILAGGSQKKLVRAKTGARGGT